MRQTILPQMQTNSKSEVMGILKMGIKAKKLTVIFGNPGSGKSSILNEYTLENKRAHVITCSPTMSMKDLLVEIANKLNVNAKGTAYAIQKQLENALIQDPNHVLLLDECEYLHNGNVTKLDVLRQIYDAAEQVPFVLCGTYKLHNLLSGMKGENQPQIFRRILKAEFPPITKDEVIPYLDSLESLFTVTFTQESRNELFALCTDIENGGLGIFIAFLEIILSFVQPEWENICYALKSGTEYDTSSLKKRIIDKNILTQASRLKMSR